MERKQESPYIPKNVKQVGEPAFERKIYVEDYVITYINRIFEGRREQEKVLLLFGGEADDGQACYIYVRGACEVKSGKRQEGGNYFTGEDFQSAMEDGRTYFKTMPLIGWALIRQGQPLNLEEKMRNTWEAYMSRIPLFLLGDLVEKEEIFYWKYDGRVKVQPGYYIFYEKNRAMQEYLVEMHGDGKNAEKTEEPDPFVGSLGNLREKLTERKTQEKSQQNFFMYGVCAFLLIVVLAIGITMINNNEKIASIQTSVDSLLENLAASEMDNSSSSGKEEESGEKAQNGTEVSKQQKAEDTAKITKKTNAGQAEETNRPEPQTNAGQAAEGAEASATQPNGDATPQATEAAAHLPEEPTTAPAEPVQPTEPVETPPAQEAAAHTNAEPAAQVTPKKHVVGKGETLEAISRAIYGNTSMVKEICQKNNITNPDAIYVGQEILLP